MTHRRCQWRAVLLIAWMSLNIVITAAFIVYTGFLNDQTNYRLALIIRTLLAERALDPDATNRSFHTCGVDISISGKVDGIGTPEDDYFAVAEAINWSERNTCGLLALFAVAISSMVAQGIVIFTVNQWGRSKRS